MKRACFLLILAFITAALSADIPPDPSVYCTVRNCDVVENAEANKAVAISTLGTNETQRYAIKDGKCLDKGYKFNQLYIDCDGKDIVLEESFSFDLGSTSFTAKRPCKNAARKRIFRIESDQLKLLKTISCESTEDLACLGTQKDGANKVNIKGMVPDSYKKK